MKINMNMIPEYRLWRTGTNKRVGSKGKLGSKLAKKIVRNNIRQAIRSARLESFKGKK